MPAQSWTSLTGKPTTVSGYGITDAYTKTQVDTAVAGVTSVSGNAGTATKLATARTIAGVSFDGSANISIPYSGLTGAPMSSGSASVATTTSTSVDSWAIATYRSAEYLIQVTQGTNYQVSKLLVIHNGTTVSYTEYGVLETNGSLATFTPAISGGNVVLSVVMGSATSASISIQKVMMAV